MIARCRSARCWAAQAAVTPPAEIPTNGHLVAQAAGDIDHLVGVSGQLFGGEAAVLVVHAVRQAAMGQGHDQDVIAQRVKLGGKLVVLVGTIGITVHQNHHAGGLLPVGEEGRLAFGVVSGPFASLEGFNAGHGDGIIRSRAGGGSSGQMHRSEQDQPGSDQQQGCSDQHDL